MIFRENNTDKQYLERINLSDEIFIDIFYGHIKGK